MKKINFELGFNKKLVGSNSAVHYTNVHQSNTTQQSNPILGSDQAKQSRFTGHFSLPCECYCNLLLNTDCYSILSASYVRNNCALSDVKNIAKKYSWGALSITVPDVILDCSLPAQFYRRHPCRRTSYIWCARTHKCRGGRKPTSGLVVVTRDFTQFITWL